MLAVFNFNGSGPMNVAFGIPSKEVMVIAFALLGGLFIVGFFCGLIFDPRNKFASAVESINTFCMVLAIFQALASLDLFFNCTEVGISATSVIKFLMLIPLLNIFTAFGCAFFGIFIAVLWGFINDLPFIIGIFLGHAIRMPFTALLPSSKT